MTSEEKAMRAVAAVHDMTMAGKASYWQTAVGNLRRLDHELAVPSLFDEGGVA